MIRTRRLALTTLAALLFFALSASAQEAPPTKIELGQDAETCDGSIAIGFNVVAKDPFMGCQPGGSTKIAIGSNAVTTGGVSIGEDVASNRGVTIGRNLSQNAGNGVLIGTNSQNGGVDTVSIGNDNALSTPFINNYGSGNKGGAYGSSQEIYRMTIIGSQNNVSSDTASTEGSTAPTAVPTSVFGSYNSVGGNGLTVTGSGNIVSGENSVISGNNVQGRTLRNATVLGNNVRAVHSMADETTYVTLDGVTGAGYDVRLTDSKTTAMGAGASAEAYGCNTFGADSSCTEAFTTSFGNATTQSRLVNIAPGRNSTDGVNYGQLQQSSSALGGGFGHGPNGTFVSPMWNFSDGSSHSNITSAFYNLDNRVGTLENSGPGGAGKDGDSAYQVAINNGFGGSEQEWLASLKGEKGDRGDAGPAGTSGLPGQDGRDGADGKDSVVPGPAGQDGKDSTVPGPNGKDGLDGKDGTGGGSDEMAVRYTNASRTTAELVGAGGTRVSNVANGRIAQGSTDAVNGGQVWELQQEFNDKWESTNRRFDQVDKRMNGLGAQTAAMSMMAGSSAGLPVGKVAVQAGVGFQSNASAFAVGYRIRTTEKVSFSAGFSFGSGGTKPMGGVGMSIILD